MDKILVTGGSGYIGSVLIRDLILNGLRPLVVDIKQPEFKCLHCACDIVNLDDLKKIASDYRPEAIVHLAGIVGDPACAAQPSRSNDVNVNGFENLLDVAKEFRVKKFINASSCSVYGSNKHLCTEASRTKPLSLYAEQKLQTERMLNWSGIPCGVNLRFGTAMGESPRMRWGLLTNLFTKKLFECEELKIFDAHQWRPYASTTDLSMAIIECLLTDNKLHGTYNVVSSNETKKTLIGKVLKILPGKDHLVKYCEGNDSDQRNYAATAVKLTCDTNWSATLGTTQVIDELAELLGKKNETK